MAFRVERDKQGEMRIPAGALWGIRSARAREQNPTGTPLAPELVQVLGAIRRAGAMASEDLGFLPTDRAEWVAMAAQELMDGFLNEQLVAEDSWKDSEILASMDEIIANRAAECMVSMVEGEELISIEKHVALFLEGTTALTARLSIGLVLEENWLSAWHTLYPLIRELLSVPAFTAPEGWNARFRERLAEVLGTEIQEGDTKWEDKAQAALQQLGKSLEPGGEPLQRAGRMLAMLKGSG